MNNVLQTFSTQGNAPRMRELLSYAWITRTTKSALFGVSVKRGIFSRQYVVST